MTASNADDDGREHRIATDAKVDSVPAATPNPAALAKPLIVGVLVAVPGAWIAANLADRVRVIENVEHSIEYQGIKQALPITTIEVGRATQNAAVAYGLVGAILSLILGVTGGRFLGRFSIPRVLAAGVAAIALGASFGAASSYGLHSYLFSPNGNGGCHAPFSLLIHLGIWTSVGAALSAALFGVGSGQSRRLLILSSSLVGGIAAAGCSVNDCSLTYLASSCRWPIPNGHFRKRPARDWRRTSSCVYA